MNLYLSRLLLNPRSRQVMSELAHPYEMHRTLMRAFPKATDDIKSKARAEFRVLFRAEVSEYRDPVKVYLQSRIEPDWSFLNQLKDYLHVDTEMPAYAHKNLMPAVRKLRNGQVLSFRLRANPTKRLARRDDTMKGKRVELRREDDQIDWLIRKGRSSGFALLVHKMKDMNGAERVVPRVNVRTEGKQKGRKKNSAIGCTTTHLAVLFEGILKVTDTNAFAETIARGIGTGKAFGFGLLSVAPVHTSGIG
jgi:CRISPR system Cascade subunit CasE